MLNKILKKNLAKSAPPRHVTVHMPLPLNELLLYSDCCIYTFYPDIFSSFVPLFNYITSRGITTVQLPLRSQFSCFITATLFGLYSSDTSPL